MTLPTLYITDGQQGCRTRIRADWEGAASSTIVGHATCGEERHDIFRVDPPVTGAAPASGQPASPWLQIGGTSFDPAATLIVRIDREATAVNVRTFADKEAYLASMKSFKPTGYKADFSWGIGGQMMVNSAPVTSGDNLAGRVAFPLVLDFYHVQAATAAEFLGDINAVVRPSEEAPPFTQYTQRDPVALPEEISLSDDRFEIDTDTTFEPGSAKLVVDTNTGREIGKETIINMVQRLKERYGEAPTLQILLGGHADVKDSQANNLSLSHERAKVVAEVIASQDIKAAIHYGGLGEQLPRLIQVSTRNGRFPKTLSLTGSEFVDVKTIPQGYEPEEHGYWYQKDPQTGRLKRLSRASSNADYDNGRATHAAFHLVDAEGNYFRDGSNNKLVFIEELGAVRTVYMEHMRKYAIDGTAGPSGYPGTVYSQGFISAGLEQNVQPKRFEENQEAKELYQTVSTESGTIAPGTEVAAAITSHHLKLEDAEIANIAKGTTPRAIAYQLAIRKMVEGAEVEAARAGGHILVHMNRVPSDIAKEIAEFARAGVKAGSQRQVFKAVRSDDVRKRPSFVATVVKGHYRLNPAKKGLPSGEYMKLWYERVGEEPRGGATFPGLAACQQQVDPRTDISYQVFINNVSNHWDNYDALVSHLGKVKAWKVRGERRNLLRRGSRLAIVKRFVEDGAAEIEAQPSQNPSKYIDAINRVVLDASGNYSTKGDQEVPLWMPESCGVIKEEEMTISPPDVTTEQE